MATRLSLQLGCQYPVEGHRSESQPLFPIQLPARAPGEAAKNGKIEKCVF